MIVNDFRALAFSEIDFRPRGGIWKWPYERLQDQHSFLAESRSTQRPSTVANISALIGLEI